MGFSILSVRFLPKPGQLAFRKLPCVLLDGLYRIFQRVPPIHPFKQLLISYCPQWILMAKRGEPLHFLYQALLDHGENPMVDPFI